MLRQLIFGSAVSLGNIATHALVMILILRLRSAVYANVPSRPALRLVGVMVAAVSMLMAAHLIEIGIWSIAYALVDVAAQGDDDFYFAFVNYTTLGYGDVIPTPRWRLLGPMTAMNGVVLFGWSTAVIFQILRTTISQNDFDVDH
jgi:Ion channel